MLANNIIAINPMTNGYRYQLGLYYHGGYSGTATYFHAKTNQYVNTPSQDNMVMIEAIGQAYSSAAPIRCAWVFYTYTYLLSGVETWYPNAMNASGVYVASDNKVCIRGSFYTIGDNWFILNAYLPSLGDTETMLSIDAASINTTSGNYY